MYCQPHPRLALGYFGPHDVKGIVQFWPQELVFKFTDWSNAGIIIYGDCGRPERAGIRNNRNRPSPEGDLGGARNIIPMKTTQYFLYTRQRPDRVIIQDEWIERVVRNPLREERQSDGRIRRWGRIPEMDNRALRVILLEDGETVHNAFFDRDFKE